ncbi:MAG: valine--tRNA ligase [Candidatus Doudnabacteria bacterium]|nr:valine--tRNA ligase [Candidatus Doudnabacteria bacterium]
MTELTTSYDHTKVEEKIYKTWEDSGFFNPDNLPGDRKQPYTIIMPPPNANAPMHLGHALFVTIEDILIRYKRMRGYKALWQPGTDHAGFETQVVFEKKLEKEGRSRFKMQREEFYKEIWDFVQSNKHITENGLRRLGASCDWDRNIFTLDPEIIKIVYATFKKMHDDGLMYRGDRIGNWCFKHQTALSDLETKYEERTEPFYYFKYGPFTIGTSRPETKFGDKYVVMHPDDKRYAQYKNGDTFEAEWINGPVKATIIKDSVVDMEFGSGVMTITPWHDQIDFDLAQKHKLDKEQIIDKFGKLLPIAGEFAGMKTAIARPLIVEKLKSKGLLVKVDENYKHNVNVCYKCGTIIEPQIIPQWFVAMTKPLPDGRPSLRDMAASAIKNKEVEIVTEKFEKIFMHWMESLRDWPVSRQIWWGIPIPVKYCKTAYQQTANSKQQCKEPVVDIENNIDKCPGCQGELVNDPDTFDTWFSSGQWPFATLMANDIKRGTKDFENFFPTQLMETGWDILFFWVARMVMMSYYRTGKKPFEKVYLHGLVRDKDRQKMSKSKGNVVDPLAVIDTYGCDALRFALIFSTSAGNDIPLAEDKIKGMKHFANKLWNIARFVLAAADTHADRLRGSDAEPKPITLADKEILAKLKGTIKSVTGHMEAFRLHEAAQDIYQFTWYEFADVYVEASKKQLTDDKLKHNTLITLSYSLITILKLLHPFMPFITEELWGILGQTELLAKHDLLMVSEWPE